jgi:hypothetical protein
MNFFERMKGDYQSVEDQLIDVASLSLLTCH